MQSTRSPRALSAGALPLALALTLSACAASTPGQLGQDLAVLETCSTDQKVASLISIDGTGTAKSEATDAINLKIVEAIARRTAICGGNLKVTAFSSGSAATVTIYDGVLELHGATDIARLKQVDEVIAEVMDVIVASYTPAIDSLPDNGTDVIGQYRLASEYGRQLSGSALEFLLLTDGLSNLGLSTEVVLTNEEATSLADSIVMPDLTGASVTVAGLGRVAGDPLPSAMVEGLVAFYDRLCANTSASSCLSVTDWSGQ